MSGHVKQIAVLASSTMANDGYADEAQALGAMLTERNYGILLAGNLDAIKGAVAQGGIENEGTVSNVYADPGSAPSEPHTPYLNDDLLKTKFMVEGRKGVKSSLTNRADVAVLLQGGFEELDQATHLARKGMPLIVVNDSGFYNGLQEQLGALKQNAYEHNFEGNDFKHIHVVDSVDEVVPIVEVYNTVGTPENDYAENWKNAQINDRRAKPSREDNLPGFTYRDDHFILATDAGIDALDRATTAIMEERNVPMLIDNSAGYYDGLLDQVGTYVNEGAEKVPTLPDLQVAESDREMSAAVKGDVTQTHSFAEHHL